MAALLRDSFGRASQLEAEATKRLLAVSDVRTAFGGIVAVAGATLVIGTAERVALVGPNGAGKTTLLNLLTGHRTPDSGRVSFLGTDVTRLPPSGPARRQMLRGYQDGGVFTRMSALANVVVPQVARGIPVATATQAAEDALRRLGLAPVMEERADRLSGGQRKLVDFARTLVVEARLYLLDEPTTGIHPTVAETMAEFIARRQEAGASFLIVSHDLPWAFGLCSRVVVMAAGEILIQGTPEEVRHDPRVREAYL